MIHIRVKWAAFGAGLFFLLVVVAVAWLRAPLM